MPLLAKRSLLETQASRRSPQFQRLYVCLDLVPPLPQRHIEQQPLEHERVGGGEQEAWLAPVPRRSGAGQVRSEECVPASSALRMPARSAAHTSALQSLMRLSYAAFCLKQ